MGKIFYLIGKSATGKDTIADRLLADPALSLKRVVQYATRPIRDGEMDGHEYHFISAEQAEDLDRSGRVIESRTYSTIHGPWRYMFVDDGQIDLSAGDYLAIGTIYSYTKVRDYYGEDKVIPLYIWVETGERLERALRRERKHDGKYLEMCRRFIADEQDFSDEHLKEAGLMREDGTLVRAFENADREECIDSVTRFILEQKEQ